MIRLMDRVRGARLEYGTEGRINKDKVEEMLRFFYRAFGNDAVLSLGGFDAKLVYAVKENEEIIKILLQSELERTDRYEINISLGNVEEIIEWIDIINNNQEKNSGIVGKQFYFTTSVIDALISFLKLYQSANNINEDEYSREKEIVLILIIKTLKYAIGSVRNGYVGAKSDIFSKFEEVLHRVLDDADLETDEKIQLIFQTKASSYGNVPKNNAWIEDFIRSVSGSGDILVHFLKKSQLNKAELLLYTDKNIVEVIIEYGNNFIFILSNSREWKKEAVLLYKTTENILQDQVNRGGIEKIINLFLQGGLPVDKDENIKVINRNDILDRKFIAEEDFGKVIQIS